MTWDKNPATACNSGKISILTENTKIDILKIKAKLQ